MKSETFRGSVESAYGEKLDRPVVVQGTYEAFETAAEVRSANEWLSDDEVLMVVNNKRKANARQKATVDALAAAGINKPDPNTPEATRARIERDMQKLYPSLTIEQVRSIVDSMQAAASQ